MLRTFSLIIVALALAHARTPAAETQQPFGDAELPAAEDPLRYVGPPRKQDEVYRISTRQLGEPLADKPFRLELQRWSESDAWEPLEFETLAGDEDADRVTFIYVHGYSFDEEKADRVGWAFYHALCDEAEAEQSIRYIIWSWPTTRKRFRPTRDLADKALRADADAYYLADMLSQLKSDEPVCVFGSSLGCRVVQGALHLAGGGSIGNWTLGDRRQDLPAHLKAVFITPCVHNDWLYDGQFHDRAILGVDRLLLVNNSVDSMLLRYAKVWRSNPVALGLDGIEHASKFGDLADRIEQFDAHEQIGDNHGVEHYLRSEDVVTRLRAFASGE